jgi:hypothetical protein
LSGQLELELKALEARILIIKSQKYKKQKYSSLTQFLKENNLEKFSDKLLFND